MACVGRIERFHLRLAVYRRRSPEVCPGPKRHAAGAALVATTVPLEKFGQKVWASAVIVAATAGNDRLESWILFEVGFGRFSLRVAKVVFKLICGSD